MKLEEMRRNETENRIKSLMISSKELVVYLDFSLIK